VVCAGILTLNRRETGDAVGATLLEENMRMTSTVAAFIAATAFAGPAGAQTAEFKCPKPGTVVDFSDGQRTTWIGADGNRCRIQQKRRDGSEVTNFWYAPTATVLATGSQTWAEQVKPSALWPLAVGKKVGGMYDGPSSTTSYRGTWEITLLVEKAERISTPAGAFDTLVVLQRQQALSHSFKSEFRQWYAPQLGVHVRFQYSDNNAQSATADATSIKQ
jgi:hypothetical protein